MHVASATSQLVMLLGMLLVSRLMQPLGQLLLRALKRLLRKHGRGRQHLKTVPGKSVDDVVLDWTGAVVHGLDTESGSEPHCPS